MLTIYKYFVNLVYFLAWPVFIYKQSNAAREWKHRRGVDRKLFESIQGANVIWLHASSVGEVGVLERIVSAIKNINPEFNYVISTYTKTGQELAINKFPDAKAVFYFPLDCYFPLRRIFARFNPKGIVIVETEIWPYFLTFCKKYNVPVILANGRLSGKSTSQYRHFRGPLSKAFAVYRKFLMQSDKDAERIESIGADASIISVLGNVKYDSDDNEDNSVKRASVREKLGLRNTDTFFLAASTRPGEEEIICEAIREFGDLKVLIAPRHLERLDEVKEILDSHNLPYCLYSEKKSFQGRERLILMDKMGILKELFYGADISFVGGTLTDIGGHNLMEPVLAGGPVIFGSSVFNVAEVSEKILASNWGAQVANANDIKAIIQKIKDGSAGFESLSGQTESVSNKTAEIIIKELGL
ncbi:MAG: hypothetical protein KAR42_08755 [candidate division Zixibacteria bacterium]|nr:hypothetical protein [candidate division Zixibacteria bacterium]